MTHAERQQYAAAMARAASGYMAESDAQELANNLACSEPNEHDRRTIMSAIAHRVREFGVACFAPDWCASDVFEVIKAYRRKSA